MKSDLRIGTLRSYYKKWGRFPTYRQAIKLFNLRHLRSVELIFRKLLEEGYIRKVKNRFSPTDKFFEIPVVGSVKAGYPTNDDQEATNITLQEVLIEKPNKTILVKVSGDSMVNAGIQAEDIIVVEKTEDAKIGDIILARIDGENTLKYFKKKNGKVYLESANPRYPAFFPNGELEIIGVVKSVIHRFS